LEFELTHYQEYDEALRQHQQKLKQIGDEWQKDLGDTFSNYNCFRESALPCDLLPGLSDDLPFEFTGACAPSFIIAGSSKSGSYLQKKIVAITSKLCKI
jgi:hypothetical protein